MINNNLNKKESNMKTKMTLNDDQQRVYYREEWPEDCFVLRYERDPDMYQGIYFEEPVSISHDLDECIKDIQDVIDSSR